MLKQRDILFDGGSANFVVKDIPNPNIEKVHDDIQAKPVEQAATNNTLEYLTACSLTNSAPRKYSNFIY